MIGYCSFAQFEDRLPSRAPPWMGLEDLLNKLLFMAVCDDGV